MLPTTKTRTKQCLGLRIVWRYYKMTTGLKEALRNISSEPLSDAKTWATQHINLSLRED